MLLQLEAIVRNCVHCNNDKCQLVNRLSSLTPCVCARFQFSRDNFESDKILCTGQIVLCACMFNVLKELRCE